MLAAGVYDAGNPKTKHVNGLKRFRSEDGLPGVRCTGNPQALKDVVVRVIRCKTGLLPPVPLLLLLLLLALAFPMAKGFAVETLF